ncbi:hypothetical protein PF003_g7450 [Phytophthora fragariae]|nr:hypothetical protein PF003_g7859 [Phytophthora fragariae]KAE8908230.1 hypothetical protein PF003_g7473 [Phytophthora fragariae]KAE8908428.1 hypothetical protein PF003_g7450 [Phytophthora fragariae]
MVSSLSSNCGGESSLLFVAFSCFFLSIAADTVIGEGSVWSFAWLSWAATLGTVACFASFWIDWFSSSLSGVSASASGRRLTPATCSGM